MKYTVEIRLGQPFYITSTASVKEDQEHFEDNGWIDYENWNTNGQITGDKQWEIRVVTEEIEVSPASTRDVYGQDQDGNRIVIGSIWTPPSYNVERTGTVECQSSSSDFIQYVLKDFFQQFRVSKTQGTFVSNNLFAVGGIYVIEGITTSPYTETDEFTIYISQLIGSRFRKTNESEYSSVSDYQYIQTYMYYPVFIKIIGINQSEYYNYQYFNTVDMPVYICRKLNEQTAGEYWQSTQEDVQHFNGITKDCSNDCYVRNLNNQSAYFYGFDDLRNCYRNIYITNCSNISVNFYNKVQFSYLRLENSTGSVSFYDDFYCSNIYIQNFNGNISIDNSININQLSSLIRATHALQCEKQQQRRRQQYDQYVAQHNRQYQEKHTEQQLQNGYLDDYEQPMTFQQFEDYKQYIDDYPYYLITKQGFIDGIISQQNYKQKFSQKRISSIVIKNSGNLNRTMQLVDLNVADIDIIKNTFDTIKFKNVYSENVNITENVFNQLELYDEKFYYTYQFYGKTVYNKSIEYINFSGFRNITLDDNEKFESNGYISFHSLIPTNLYNISFEQITSKGITFETVEANSLTFGNVNLTEDFSITNSNFEEIIINSMVSKNTQFYNVTASINIKSQSNIDINVLQCKNFTFSHNVSVQDQYKTVDNKNDYWLLKKYQHTVTQQNRGKDFAKKNLILTGDFGKVFIYKSSYDDVNVYECDFLNITDSYLRNAVITQKYENNNTIKLNSMLSETFELYGYGELQLINSVVNFFKANYFEKIYFTQNTIGQLQLYQFRQLYFLYNTVYKSKLSSTIGRIQHYFDGKKYTTLTKTFNRIIKNIKIRSCQFGKMDIYTKGLVLNAKEYDNYLDAQLNRRVDNYKNNYLKNHATLDDGYFVGLKNINKLKEKTERINRDYFDSSDQFFQFNVQNCKFCCMLFDSQPYSANIYHNISTQDLKYKPLSENNEKQWVYNDKNTLDPKYKRSMLFDNFKSVLFSVSSNVVQRIHVNNNSMLKHICLNGNESILKYVQLTNNQNLQSFDLYDNNVLQQLTIRNCKLKKIDVNKTTFPKLKVLEISQNDKTFDWGNKVYKNEIVLDQIRIKQTDIQRQMFYNLTQRLQFNDSYDEENNFICQIVLNNSKVYIKQQTYNQLIDLFKKIGYIENTRIPKIKIFKDSTIQQLNISNDLPLRKIIVKDTNFDSFDLNGSVQYVDLSCNKLNYLKFTNLSSLQYFDISNNNLTCFYSGNQTNIVLSKKLTQFYAKNNNITGTLKLNDNLLSYINVDYNSNLKQINLNNNQLEQFIVKQTGLNKVYINNQSKIITVKLENNQTKQQTVYTLKTFKCDNVDYISMNNNINLETFISRNGRLQNFQLYENALIECKIKYLDISNSGVKGLYLDNCYDLYYLNINNCNGIDLRFPTKKLKQLYCSNAGLSQLNIRNSILTDLDASFNHLKSLQLPITIKKLNLSNNELHSVKLSPIYNSIINLRGNLLHLVQINNANNISSFQSDYIQNLYLTGNEANNFTQFQSFDNIKKLCFYNKNNNLQLRNKNIQNIQLYCTETNNQDELLFVQNCKITNCKITSVNNYNNGFGLIVNINYSMLEKLIMDYSYIKQINILDNYLKKIIITKPLNIINKITILQSNGSFDIQQFLKSFYSNLNHNNGGQIIISSIKFNPYYSATQQLINKITDKNWQIKLN